MAGFFPTNIWPRRHYPFSGTVNKKRTKVLLFAYGCISVEVLRIAPFRNKTKFYSIKFNFLLWLKKRYFSIVTLKGTSVFIKLKISQKNISKSNSSLVEFISTFHSYLYLIVLQRNNWENDWTFPWCECWSNIYIENVVNFSSMLTSFVRYIV